MKRAPLVLLVCVALFVATGFAANKKIQRNDRSRDWNDSSLQNNSPVQNDLSLQNGDLPSVWSGVSGGGPGFQLGGGYQRSGPPNPEPISMPDNSNGGTGNWSAGAAGVGSHVTIYSGGNDTVTLNLSSTINSLIGSSVEQFPRPRNPGSLSGMKRQV